MVGEGFAIFELDFIFEFELMVEVEFDFMLEVPDVLDVFVLIVDDEFVVPDVFVLIVDAVFVMFALLLFIFVLFAVSPPQAIPRAVKPKRADRAINFFIRNRSPVFLKDYVLLFYLARR